MYPVTKLITGPEAEPITRDQAKLHLRVDHAAEDAYIDGLIKTARLYVEDLCGALITQTWKAFYDSWPESEFILPKGQIQSVTHVKYTDTAGVTTTLGGSTYLVDIDMRPGRVIRNYGTSWPAVALSPRNPIEVQFIAGYGNAGTDIPDPIRHALLLLIGHWFAHREGITLGERAAIESKPLAMGIEALLRNYRR